MNDRHDPTDEGAALEGLPRVVAGLHEPLPDCDGLGLGEVWPVRPAVDTLDELVLEDLDLDEDTIALLGGVIDDDDGLGPDDADAQNQAQLGDAVEPNDARPPVDDVEVLSGSQLGEVDDAEVLSGSQLGEVDEAEMLSESQLGEVDDAELLSESQLGEPFDAQHEAPEGGTLPLSAVAAGAQAPPPMPPAATGPVPSFASAAAAAEPTTDPMPRMLEDAAPARGGDDDGLAELMKEITASEEPPTATGPRRTSESWFAEIFDETWLKLLPARFYQRTVREAAFMGESLGLGAGARVLDVACGFGRHTVELASRGLSMTGLDLSRPLLRRGVAEARRRELDVRFVHGDMRDIGFDAEFDGVVCWHTSFGYFDDVSNLDVLRSLYASLRSGGRLLIEVANRDYVVRNLPRRIWWETDELLLMEEVDFEPRTSRLEFTRNIVRDASDPWEQTVSLRLYAAHELCGLLAVAGFRPLELSGDIAHRGIFFADCNRSVCVLAEKP